QAQAQAQAQAAAQAQASAAAAAARARQAAAAQAARSASRTSAPVPVPSGSPQSIARAMLTQRGWSGQWSCLNSLWQKESGWNYRARNPSSGAFGIPQALPGSKMASAGPDWQTNPATQIAWGLSYIASTYGTPCGAWAHSQSTGWY
ncbi:MAG TPA: transglycosylase SLT domain-containing protein, partial [Kineosporiaceae bacterium]|nr:transglycosylase SLT domain-containing protein [Kineosporiaceae bacterium]